MCSAVNSKRSRPRPNRRQQALVFVEPYKNPVKESRLPETKHLVKKWSMLNRKNDTKSDLTSITIDRPYQPSSRPCQAGHSLSEAAPSSVSSQHRNIIDAVHDEDDEVTEAFAYENYLQLTHSFRDRSLRNPLARHLGDPFNTLPTSVSDRAFGLIHQYLTHHYVESRPWFKADDEYGSLLVDARKQTWFPVAKESQAACAALVALVAAANPFTSEYGTIRDTYLVEAFRLTNDELTSQRALSNSTLLAVVMLMVAALKMNDYQAFASHARGMLTLLVHRSNHPERAENYIQPQWYAFEPCIAQQKLRFKGTGLSRLTQRGFISQTAWSTYFKPAMSLCSLVLLTPGDTFWFSALTQHKWLTGNPATLGSTALDNVFHSTLRLVWHLIAWDGCLLNSPIIPGMILGIYASLNRADVEALLLHQPKAVTWVALSAGPFAMNLQTWFHIMLRLSLAASGISEFDHAASVLAEEYLWHPNMNAKAETFWRQNPYQTTPRSCGVSGNDSPDLRSTEEQLIASYETLELEENFRPELQTQTTKCRQCLCAWWV